jgi:hypothetical protein
LGEIEDPRVENLQEFKLKNRKDPRATISWLKLTHDNSGQYTPQTAVNFTTQATYQLSPSQGTIDWSEIKAIFWMSGSSFDEALRRGLDISKVEHASGPGWTHQFLVSALERAGILKVPEIFLDYESWRLAKLASN